MFRSTLNRSLFAAFAVVAALAAANVSSAASTLRPSPASSLGPAAAGTQLSSTRTAPKSSRAIPSGFRATFTADGTTVFAASACEGTRFSISTASGPSGSYFRYWIYSYRTGTWSAPSNWTWINGLAPLSQLQWNPANGTGTFVFYGQFAHYVGGAYQYAEGYMGQITWSGGPTAGNFYCFQSI